MRCPEEGSSLFPFPRIRSGQKELLSDVESVLSDGRHLIAHAPTGIGKTVAVLTPALDYVLKNNKTIIFLTPKQSQHKIAVETLKMIKSASDIDFIVVDIISKQDMCPRSISKEHHAFFSEFCKIEQKTRSCRYFRRYDNDIVNTIIGNILHVEELCDLCNSGGVCPHRTALDAAENADVIICDYNYIFSRISETLLPRIGRSLEDLIIIVDEAHNLPDRIRDQLSDVLTLNDITEASNEMRNEDRTLYRHLTDLRAFFNNMIKNMPDNSETKVDRGFFISGVEKILKSRFDPISYEEFIDELRRISLDSKKDYWHMMDLAEFLDGWSVKERCSRIFTNNESPKLSYKLLDPSVLSGDVLSNSYSVIMMSGTMYPMEMYAEILGADPKRTLLREYESPFPKENRLIVVTKELTTRYAERGDLMYRRIAEKISKILDCGSGNTAVFFPSYALMQSVMVQLPGKVRREIIVEERGMNKEQKNGLYEFLKNSGGTLFGVQAGSLSEGIDYEENILTSVIVVGIPLGPPTLDTKNLLDYYLGKFGREKGRCYGYVYPAMNRALQAAGRGIRSEDDIGIIVLMDYRFESRPYSDCFPSDYNVQSTGEVEKLCAEFLQNHGRMG
ncbi:MAG: ATP-dependent DNA helicase [Halobacteriota archaeon]|nr:ATP-dependent DNA helicase [Halobacteriota archaeon]